jgi:hypothetical protein
MKTRQLEDITSKEFWFENFDFTCPVCGGTGENPFTNGGNCRFCAERGESYFDILWNTLFEVPYLKPGLDFPRAKRITWRLGWLLIADPDDGSLWLAAGSCGYDFTWPRAKVIIALCGQLPADYADDVSSGGYVFVNAHDAQLIAREVIRANEIVILLAMLNQAEQQLVLDKLANPDYQHDY